MRTNPEYAALAYRKALLNECIAHLIKFTGASGEPPIRRIVSEDVVREDSEIPEEEIVTFITDMEQEKESIRLELAKFDFRKRDENVSKQDSTREESHQDRRESAKQKGKRRRAG